MALKSRIERLRARELDVSIEVPEEEEGSDDDGSVFLASCARHPFEPIPRRSKKGRTKSESYVGATIDDNRSPSPMGSSKMTSRIPVVVGTPPLSTKTEEWVSIQMAIINLFQGQEMETNELAYLHKQVSVILHSNARHFLFEYYQTQLLRQGMAVLNAHISKEKDLMKMFQTLEETWEHFFANTLPMLQSIMFAVKCKKLTIRQITLVSFRDEVLLKLPIKDILQIEHARNSAVFKQMLLVLQGVIDTYPPNKNRLELESFVARLVVPYLGYRGIYRGRNEPDVESMEPLVARRKSIDLRKLSRPLSVQPENIHTLEEMFKSALARQAGGRN